MSGLRSSKLREENAEEKDLELLRDEALLAELDDLRGNLHSVIDEVTNQPDFWAQDSLPNPRPRPAHAHAHAHAYAYAHAHCNRWQV